MRTLPPVVLGLVVATAVVGCGGSGERSRVAVCKQGTKVDLKVLHGRNDVTLALVPVTIEGKGPFSFALDTGATVSAIDDSLVKKLGLSMVGNAGPVRGVVGAKQAKLVEVPSWKVGSVGLGKSRIAALNLFGSVTAGPRGLLGSDVLSRFSSVCIDYDSKILRVGKR